MGWGRYLLLGNFGQQLDINDQTEEIQSMRAQMSMHAPGSVTDLKILQRENDELKMYLSAMVGILLNKQVMTREELKAMVDVIDKADGKADGRYTGSLAINTSDRIETIKPE